MKGLLIFVMVLFNGALLGASIYEGIRGNWVTFGICLGLLVVLGVVLALTYRFVRRVER